MSAAPNGAALNGVATLPAAPAASTAELAGFLALVARAASDPAVDVAKMQALLEMQARVLAHQAEAAFNEAFTRLSAVLPRIRKGGRVDIPPKAGRSGGSYQFAKFEDIDAAVRPLLREHGFSLSYDAEPMPGGGLLVTGRLLHVGGHARKASIPLPADNSGGKNPVQGMGSTISYGRRYCAAMLLNLVWEGEDDDGRGGDAGPAQRQGDMPLTREQVQRLTRLLHETRSNAGRFLVAMFPDDPDIAGIEDIRQRDFARCLQAVEAKLRRMRAEGGR